MTPKHDPEIYGLADITKTMGQRYLNLQRRQELERAARVRADEQARTVQMIGEWRQAVEDIAKLETVLSTAIAQEKQWIGDALGWPSRLDQMLGELSRYRETLMRRISDKAVDRLSRPPVFEDDGGRLGG